MLAGGNSMTGDLDLNSERFDKHPDFIRELFAGLFSNPDLHRLVSDNDFIHAFEYYEDFIDFFPAANFPSVEAYLQSIDPESDQIFDERSHVLLKLCAEYLANHAPEAPRYNYGSVVFDDLQLALAYGDMLGHLGGHYDEGIWMRFEPAELCVFGVQLLRAVTHVIGGTDNRECRAYWKSRQIYLIALTRANNCNEAVINLHYQTFWNSKPDAYTMKSIREACRLPAFCSFGAD